MQATEAEAYMDAMEAKAADLMRTEGSTVTDSAYAREWFFKRPQNGHSTLYEQMNASIYEKALEGEQLQLMAEINQQELEYQKAEYMEIEAKLHSMRSEDVDENDVLSYELNAKEEVASDLHSLTQIWGQAQWLEIENMGGIEQSVRDNIAKLITEQDIDYLKLRAETRVACETKAKEFKAFFMPLEGLVTDKGRALAKDNQVEWRKNQSIDAAASIIKFASLSILSSWTNCQDCYPNMKCWMHHFLVFYSNAIHSKTSDAESFDFRAQEFLNLLEAKFDVSFVSPKGNNLHQLLTRSAQYFRKWSHDESTGFLTDTTYFCLTEPQMIQERKNSFMSQNRVTLKQNDIERISTAILFSHLTRNNPTQEPTQEMHGLVETSEILESLADPSIFEGEKKISSTKVYALLRFLGRDNANLFQYDSAVGGIELSMEYTLRDGRSLYKDIDEKMLLWQVQY